MVKINLDDVALDSLFKKWKETDTEQTFDEYVNNLLGVLLDGYFKKLKD